jgi:Acyl-CoA carboxylase epsilon subunit
MTDNNSRDPKAFQANGIQANGIQANGIQAQNTPAQNTPAPAIPMAPVRLVRGTASPEELSALIAVVAVMSSSGGEDAAGSEAHRAAHSAMYPRPQWNAPTRMVRKAYPAGPGGWRASAFPR